LFFEHFTVWRQVEGPTRLNGEQQAVRVRVRKEGGKGEKSAAKKQSARQVEGR